jgi:hypothetical protein
MLLALMAGGLPARQGTSRVQSRFSSHATIPAAATYATLLARLDLTRLYGGPRQASLKRTLLDR